MRGAAAVPHSTPRIKLSSEVISMRTAAAVPGSRVDWLVPLLLIILGLIPSLFGVLRLAQIAGGAEPTPDNARFLAQPLPVVLHLLAVVPFSLLGALQFSPRFHRHQSGWHRAAGRVLAPLGLVSALTGLWMAHFYPWPPLDGRVVYAERLVVGVVMTIAILLALDAIRRRDFAAHGAWMIRGYALGMGAGTQVLTHLPWMLFAGSLTVSSRAFCMGVAWAINALVAEWVIRRMTRRRRAGTAGVARAIPVAMPELVS